MIAFDVQLSGITPLSRDQVIRLIQVTGRYESLIMLIHNSRTINGKSLLGLLSLGATGDDPVGVRVDGVDEEKAAEALRILLEEGIRPEKSIEDAWEWLHQLKESLMNLLGENLAGIYVHGSVADGCFQWKTSDIDFLVLVRREMAPDDKVRFVQLMEALSESAPPAGIECRVMLTSDAARMAYPAPFQLHFSAMWRDECKKDPKKFCEWMHGADPDLTTHVLSLRRSGVALLGDSPARAFGTVDRDDCLKAMMNDLEDAEAVLAENPVYAVLNLCRALAFKRENLSLSKPEGGRWAMQNLNARYQGVIQAAINAYEQARDMFFDREAALDFCQEAVEELANAAEEK